MQIIRYTAFLTIAFIGVIGCNKYLDHEDYEQPMWLWYDKPASDWNEALPIGNVAEKDINQKPIFEYDIVTEAGKR